MDQLIRCCNTPIRGVFLQDNYAMRLFRGTKDVGQFSNVQHVICLRTSK